MLRARLAEPVHDPLQHRLDDPQERALGGIPGPARLHQLPAFLVEHRQTLWTHSWKRERDPLTISTPQICEQLWLVQAGVTEGKRLESNALDKAAETSLGTLLKSLNLQRMPTRLSFTGASPLQLLACKLNSPLSKKTNPSTPLLIVVPLGASSTSSECSS